MRAPVPLALSALLTCAASSCIGHTPPSLEDSRGVRVEWACSGGACEVTGTSVPPPTCTALPDLDLFVLGAGSMALLCGASIVEGSLELHETSCRPIRCADDEDCPQWDDRRYACASGVCATSSRAPTVLDVNAACLADVDRPATCLAAETDPATAAALMNAADACTGTTCTIPEACRP